MRYSLRNRGILTLLVFCLLWLNCLPVSSHVAADASVNAVIGDISYYERFRRLPTESTDETLRIRTHLSYVEKLLRSHVPSSIQADMMPRRKQMLDLLQTYHQRGVFPTQQAFKARQPHFIDEQGRLCAVGHLIAETAGHELAERINQKYSYAYLPDMNLPELKTWVAGSGLTVQELAMIQPAYGDMLGNEAVDHAYGITLLTLIAIQAIAVVFHLGTSTSLADPAWYQEIQAYDVIGTMASLGLLILLSLATPKIPGLGFDSKLFAPAVGMLAATIFGVPNVLLLNGIGEKAHPEAREFSLGLFQTPDQQTTWGLHASMSF